MKRRYGLVLFTLLINTAHAVDVDWLGEWKINDKNKYMSFKISNATPSGLSFSYDEGIGINGIRINGVLNISENNIGFVDASVRGNPCHLNLQLSKNKTITLSNCELDSYDDANGEKIFVPRSRKLYFNASFNCTKAGTKIELAICDSKIIAAADKKLGTIYKGLRKKLSRKNVKKLKKEQRLWIKDRDAACKQRNNKELDYCLRQSYGQRLFALNVLNNYNLWHNGSFNYSVFSKIETIKKKSKTNSYFNIMEHGLGLWLSGKMKRQLIDTGNYEIQTEFLNNSYILTGPYNANPSEGHDPRAYGNKIFIEFSSAEGVWVGLVSSGHNLIYMPKNKSVSNASEVMGWIKSIEEQEIIKVF